MLAKIDSTLLAHTILYKCFHKTMFNKKIPFSAPDLHDLDVSLVIKSTDHVTCTLPGKNEWILLMWDQEHCCYGASFAEMKTHT